MFIQAESVVVDVDSRIDWYSNAVCTKFSSITGISTSSSSSPKQPASGYWPLVRPSSRPWLSLAWLVRTLGFWVWRLCSSHFDRIIQTLLIETMDFPTCQRTEIHRAADKIPKHWKERSSNIEITLPQFSGREHDFLGKTVNKVEARGKALLIHFDSFVMYSHNQLYGRWTVNLRTTEAKVNRSMRVALTTNKHTCRLVCNNILLMEPWELSGHPYLAKLGPDVVIGNHTQVWLTTWIRKPTREETQNPAFRSGFFAGIGNYLRSEVLFNSGLHPDRTVGSLSDEEGKLAQEALFLSRQSFHNPGITIELGCKKTRDVGSQEVKQGTGYSLVMTRNAMSVEI